MADSATRETGTLWQRRARGFCQNLLPQSRVQKCWCSTASDQCSDPKSPQEALVSSYPYSHGAYDLQGFRVFSGCEVTVAERADFIVLGEIRDIWDLDHAFPRPLFEGYSVPAPDFLKTARGKNVILIAAHPYCEGKELAKLPLAEVLAHVDTVEVNGRDHGSERRVASLAAEAGLPLTGGSDAHYYLEVGTRSTILPSNALTFERVRSALKANRTRVHCKPYARSVGEPCKQIKRALKVRMEYAASTTAAA
jgi:hypothetical protein